MRAAFRRALMAMLCLLAWPVSVVSAGESYTIGSRGAQKPAHFAVPTEVKSPWYMRVEAGYVANSSGDLSLSGDSSLTLRSFADDADGSGVITVGLGYRVSPSFRIEGAFDVQPISKVKAAISGRGKSVTATDGDPVDFALPGGARTQVATTDMTRFDVDRDQDVKSRRQSLMLFGYWDLVNGSRITPYVGGGFGANLHFVRSRTTDDYKCLESSNEYDNPATGNRVTTKLPSCLIDDYTAASSKTTYAIGFAAAAAAGLGIQIAPTVNLDIGYRLMWQAAETTLRWDASNAFPSASINFSDRLDHEIRTGIRIAFD